MICLRNKLLEVMQKWNLQYCVTSSNSPMILVCPYNWNSLFLVYQPSLNILYQISQVGSNFEYLDWMVSQAAIPSFT